VDVFVKQFSPYSRRKISFRLVYFKNVPQAINENVFKILFEKLIEKIIKDKNNEEVAMPSSKTIEQLFKKLPIRMEQEQ